MDAQPSRAFYYENFSTTPDGTLPADWTGGDNLVVGQVGRRRALFISTIDDDIQDRAATPAIRFAQDFRVEAIVTMERGNAWGGGCPATFGMQIGSVSVGTNTHFCDQVVP